MPRVAVLAIRHGHARRRICDPVTGQPAVAGRRLARSLAFPVDVMTRGRLAPALHFT